LNYAVDFCKDFAAFDKLVAQRADIGDQLAPLHIMAIIDIHLQFWRGVKPDPLTRAIGMPGAHDDFVHNTGLGGGPMRKIKGSLN
ncbi:hypothetical protein, partial [Pseudomonas aeruginosa]